MLIYVTTVLVMINSKVKIRPSFLTLTTTDNFATPSRISCHIPMSSTRSPRGRRNIVTILYASTLISMRLFKSAKSGPKGNADTNIVINPYWITRIENIKIAPRRLSLILFYKIFLKKKLTDQSHMGLITIKQKFVNRNLTAVLILDRINNKSVKWSDYPENSTQVNATKRLN